MSFSRRDFLKAAGAGTVLTAVTGENLSAAPAISKPFTTEKATFLVNGKTRPPSTKRAPRCGK